MSDKKRKVPKLRFPGFTDDWEQRKLGEVAEIIAGGDIDKDKISFDGGYPVIANALSKDGIVGYYKDYYRVEAPAVTVTGRGEIGVARSRKINFTPVVRLLSIRSNYDVDFLEHSINIKNTYVESTGVPQLTVPQLAKYLISAPLIVEQEAIGKLFHKFDSLISLHQRKLDNIKMLKKSLLQKLFPKDGEKIPELRFPGFTDAWEQRKLGEVVFRRNAAEVTGALPGVEYEDVIPEEGRLNKNVSLKEVTKKGLEFLEGDVLFGKLRPYLKNWLFAEFNGVAVGDWWVLYSDKVDGRLIYYLIQTDSYQTVANLSTGTKMPRSDWTTVSQTIFAFPVSADEQLKIGKYFSSIDSLISLHQRKLDHLKELKKGLLQQMFV